MIVARQTPTSEPAARAADYAAARHFFDAPLLDGAASKADRIIMHQVTVLNYRFLFALWEPANVTH